MDTEGKVLASTFAGAEKNEEAVLGIAGHACAGLQQGRRDYNHSPAEGHLRGERLCAEGGRQHHAATPGGERRGGCEV